MDDAARAKFRSRWRELLEGDPTKSRIYKDMGNGVATAGIEYYLPLFFDETATVFDYLGEDATVVLHGDLEPAFQRFWQDTKERFRLVQGDPDRPALPPESLFLGIEQFYTRANAHAQLALRAGTEDLADNPHFQKLGDLSVVRGAEDPLARLHAHIRNTQHRVLLLAESDGRRESLLDFLRASQLNPPAFDSLAEFQGQADERVGIATAALATGFAWLEEGIDFVTETELFAAGTTTRRRKKQEQVSDVEALIKDLSELTLGDPVVHSAHGIGRYRGLIHMDVGARRTPTARPRCRSSCTSNTPTRPCSTCRSASCSSSAATRACPPTRHPCTSWAAASGKKPSARPPSRCAIPPPSCSTSTPAAQRARATPSATAPRTTSSSPTTSASRKRPTRTPPSTR